MGYKIAVVGATGAVGKELLSILAERQFPVDEVVALASERSAGVKVSFGEDDTLEVQDLSRFDFRGTDIVLSSPGASVSAKYSPIAAKAGAVVIDNTSHFRMDPDVPLIVPEVNPDAIAGYTKRIEAIDKHFQAVAIGANGWLYYQQNLLAVRQIN